MEMINTSSAVKGATTAKSLKKNPLESSEERDNEQQQTNTFFFDEEEDKLHQPGQTPEEQDEGDDHDQADREESLKLDAKDQTLSKNLIHRMTFTLDGCSSEKELVETCDQIFKFIMLFANSIQSKDIEQSLAALGSAIVSKVKSHLTSHDPHANVDASPIVRDIIGSFVTNFSSIDGASEHGHTTLTQGAAMGLYVFVEQLIMKKISFKVGYSGELTKVLIALTRFLNRNSVLFCANTLEVYNFISSQAGFSAEDFQKLLQSINNNSKFAYQSYLFSSTKNQTGLSKLATAYEELVMNDKEKSNHINIKFFVPYLTSLDATSFTNQILPSIEFMMKRNGSLICLIQETVQALPFDFTPELVLALTANIFSDEYLVKEELFEDCKSFFATLAKKCLSNESAKALLQDYIFERFVKTRNSSITAVQRLSIIRYLSIALRSLKSKDLIGQEQLQTILSATLEHLFLQKEEAHLRDSFQDTVALFEQASSLNFLNEIVKKQVAKVVNIWHINLFTDLMTKKSIEMKEIVATLVPHLKQLLITENFKTSVNYSQVLALIGFFCQAHEYMNDQSLSQWMIQNDHILSYLTTQSGYVNTKAFFEKNLSLHDVRSHLHAIQTLLINHYTVHPLKNGDHQLRDTLCEYLLNEQIIFREHFVLNVLDKIPHSASDNFISPFLTSLLNKIKEVSQRPPTYNREEAPHKQNINNGRKVQVALKVALKLKTKDLTQDEFLTLVKIVCHPFVSSTNKDLLRQLKSLDAVYPNGKLQAYFEEHSKVLSNYAIRERTGILSPNSTLRATAINIAVALAQYNLINAFIGDVAEVMNYRPLEMCHKLEKMFVQEFDKISFYDLMFYSEVSKDLLNVFSARDAATIKQELTVQGIDITSQGMPDGSVSSLEEEKQEPEAAAIDPSKLAAMMLKQAAAAKKAGAAGKKPAAKAPSKPATQPAKKTPQSSAQSHKEEASPAHQPVDKEKRKKADREQILKYIQEIQLIKGQHVSAALEIVKRANLNNLYLDLTLNHLLMPMVKLLSYPATRFSTNLCLNSLFQAHKNEPLFQVKTEIVSCLNALSAQRIYIKHMREFQQIFQHIENNTQVSFFDKGYIQMIMMMANFVLKDLSVHLSVKEQALAVVQDILENSNLVENIDLVIVTINMMKSSYNNENLGQYLNLLLRRLSLDQLALILQRTFEYEPVPRLILLRELLEYEQPLCCPVWFSSQLWILQFDEECGKLARRLWNKYGMVLRNGVLDMSKEMEFRNVFYYLKSKNTQIFDNSIRAMVASIEIFQNRYDLIIDDLIEFYNKEMAYIEQETAITMEQEGGQSSGQKNILADERLNRIAAAEIIKRTAHLVHSTSFKKIFDFFIVQGCLDQNEQVSKACMDAALQVIQVKGQDYSEEMLKILEKYINEQKKYSELSKNQAIIMIGALAGYLDNTSQKKLIGTFEKMLELLNTPSELIRQSICKVIPQLARFFDDKSRKLLEEHFKVLRETQDEKIIRGSAYAVAGILKGLGMQTFLSMDIMKVVKNECFAKHSDPLRKVSGLYLYETLTISYGKVFEMYVEKILPDILQCIADPKEQVRRAALQANRTIMSRLSNHAIKQVLPIFLKGLYNDNWRSKLASVEALGNTAFCAPRQIASFLPQIVKGIREVLTDTHEKVHEAALQAIQNIGSVIKCPEIADILETLVKALSNPNVYLKDAMKVLLETSFVHAIDAPSLSLLIPILDSGLMMHDNESKQLASKLMGNICNLTQDPEDLLPYIKILMPAIKNSLFDSIPEIRASAAKALGSLSKGLGLENSDEMLQWLHSVLNQKQLHASERSGAAQGLAEIISVHGTKFFEDTIKQIVTASQDSLPHIRESYRSVMVFLATCYDQFVKYLPKLLPIMIQGLSDDVEEVRKISLRNVKICIKLFGKQAPNQLVTPIMEMMFHKDFRVRQSSSVLMYQLVKELENDVIKSQPKYISQETKSEILSSMFILKYDIIERVATQAAQIWKNIIDNQLKVLKSIIHVLTKQLFDLIQSDTLELEEMGLNCMRGIVEKFGEKFVGDMIDILESYMERATTLQQNIAITKAIYNMSYAAPIKLLSDLRTRFLTVIDGNISHENEQIRTLTAKTFTVVFQKTFEPLFMINTLDKQYLKKLHHFISIDQTREAELLIMTLKEILREQPPELKLEDKIIRICNAIDQKDMKLTMAQSRILATVAAKIGANMFKKKNCIAVLDRLLKELTVDEIDDERRVNEVLITFSEVIAQSPEAEISIINEQLISDFYMKCRNSGRLEFYVDFIAYYCQNAKVNYEKFAKMYLENVLVLMNDSNDRLVEKVTKSYTAVINGLQKENQFTLIPLIKQCIEDIAVLPIQVGHMRTLYKKKVQTIKMLEKPEGVKNLSSVIQNSITHGSIDIRIDSAICFQYLIDFSKPEAIKTEIIKICGALIRVVNDKFPPTLKLQIFQALKLILLRASLFAKAMAPQLQTTFLKAFSDKESTSLVRKVVVDCLIHFLKIAPKIDPIIKELAVMIEGDKLENNAKVEVAEILGIIIRLNGKNLQPAMSSQLQTTLLSIVQCKPGSTFNDKTVTNCAVALAFLSAYSAEPAEQVKLFEAFNSTMNLNVMFGIKYGILLNGNSAPYRQKFLGDIEKDLAHTFKDMTGLEEVDQRYSEDAKEEGDHGRLHGVFELMGHIGDVVVRRFANGPTDEVYAQQFKFVNQAGILKKLNSIKNLENKQTFEQVLFYLSSIPVKSLTQDQPSFDPNLSDILKEGFEFINNFYLEFDSKKAAQPAIYNMLMFNYDNFLDINEDGKIYELTESMAKALVNKEAYLRILPENIRMLAVELLFI